jgi:hypothetical protein
MDRHTSIFAHVREFMFFPRRKVFPKLMGLAGSGERDWTYHIWSAWQCGWGGEYRVLRPRMAVGKNWGIHGDCFDPEPHQGWLCVGLLPPYSSTPFPEGSVQSFSSGCRDQLDVPRGPPCFAASNGMHPLSVRRGEDGPLNSSGNVCWLERTQLAAIGRITQFVLLARHNIDGPFHSNNLFRDTLRILITDGG